MSTQVAITTSPLGSSQPTTPCVVLPSLGCLLLGALDAARSAVVLVVRLVVRRRVHLPHEVLPAHHVSTAPSPSGSRAVPLCSPSLALDCICVAERALLRDAGGRAITSATTKSRAPNFPSQEREAYTFPRMGVMQSSRRNLDTGVAAIEDHRSGGDPSTNSQINKYLYCNFYSLTSIRIE